MGRAENRHGSSTEMASAEDVTATEGRGLRITTWNVNGIRNPFGYQPWSRERTFAAMFDILEADIVVMQETKIQRKDLRDDMVLVPGWDVFFSLPKHKKGYSGVAIYTRNSICAPIRAEEGITGILTPPGSTTSYYDLPEDQQIGGYPTVGQLAGVGLDSATLDSEGRCVILEFPAFVLVGTYCPANRDETRDEFRIGYLDAVDARIRNLVAMGKRVFWTGDLNIMREGIDTAKLDDRLKKENITYEEFLSTPARRMLNQLLVGGKVFGERDEGREKAVLWDICRSFHPERQGMFTCWEQKINARPGNFGARIDYVLCSEDWKDWFCASDIQEGLMGSDHCPVYAIIKQKVQIEGKDVDIRDVMSDGLFEHGIRKREWSQKYLLPLSARLIQEFAQRRSIRDMFTKRPSMTKQASSMTEESPTPLSVQMSELQETAQTTQRQDDTETPASAVQALPDAFSPPEVVASPFGEAHRSPAPTMQSPSQILKRSIEPTSSVPVRPQKKGKTASSSKTATTKNQAQSGKGQSSLMGFFKPKTPTANQSPDAQPPSTEMDAALGATSMSPLKPESPIKASQEASSTASPITSPSKFNLSKQKDVIDPIVAKETWGKLLSKRVVPRCEHNEPCISLLTKKPGVNCGRSFYMCPRPIGPSGQKERNTQWRCGTFIWSSDWQGE